LRRSTAYSGETVTNKGRIENLKPFVKGDARINRAGRPKDFEALRKLVQSVGNEIAVDAQGNPILNPATGAPYTRIELAVRGMMSNPKQLKTLLAYGYGTPPTNVDVTSGGEKIKGYAVFNPDDWDKPDSE